MDTSQNRDIAMRQNLLSVGGKNTLPPKHIMQQQRRLSQSQLSKDRKIFIHSKHKELCPLCHRPSYIFKQHNQYVIPLKMVIIIYIVNYHNLEHLCFSMFK